MPQRNNTTLTRIDILLLERKEPEDLAVWWCLLNRERWPQPLPNPDLTFTGLRRNDVMEWIDTRIGHKPCARAWYYAMTDEQFEDYWNQWYDMEARERYLEWALYVTMYSKYVRWQN